MGRVVMVATGHFMLFGMVAVTAGIPNLNAPEPTLLYHFQAFFLLPLLPTLNECGVIDALSFLPYPLRPLIALAIFAGNSLIFGFAADGYLRIMSRFYRLWREGRMAE
jgi:hypothetical protein